MKYRRHLFFVLGLSACSSSLGKLGVIDDDDAGTSDAGREAASDAGAVDSGAITDATLDVTQDADAEAGPTRVSPEGGRPTAAACADAGRPAGQPGDAGGCTADTDCDGGVDGRCGLRRFTDGGSANVCTYHACIEDTTCGGTSVCGCGAGTLQQQNVCLSNSSCRTDGDCTNGERCVYSDPIIFRVGGPGIYEGNEVGGINYLGDAIGFFCTTPRDDCGPIDSGIAHRCIYNLESKRWQWGYGP